MVTKIKNTNIDLSGSTDGTVMPSGSEGQRPSATAGLLRYNSTKGNLEQANGSEFQAIDLPPSISSLSGNWNPNDDTNITITGTNFKSGATVTFINSTTNLSVGTASVVVRNSSTELVATTGFNSTPISASITALKVKVTNPSGLDATSLSTVSPLLDPIFVNAAGSLGTIYDSGRSAGVTFTAEATVPDSLPIQYSISSGAIPTGMSFNTSTALISGTPDAVGSDTAFTFTVTAVVQSVDSAIRQSSREYSITIAAPTVEAFTTAGADTFTAPFTGNYEVLVVGGGGSGGSSAGGGGGGVVYKASHPLTAGTIPMTVGAGGSSSAGTDTTFSNITARGGGYVNQNGGANTGGMGPQGTQSGCNGTSYTSTQANVADGGTPYGGYRGGGYRDGHYFWGGGGGGGSGGNGEEPHGCGGTCDGGVGVNITQFSTYGESGYFGGGGNGNQQRYDPVNPNGGSGVDGLGNNAPGTGGGGSSGGSPGGIYIRY